MAIGLWREGAGQSAAELYKLTTQLGPDVAPYHNRQVVVLRPRHWTDWLT
jgi:putative SOS response-associated peptidase YedK